MEVPIPEGIRKLSSLSSILLQHNSFERIITEVHSANLTRLKMLDISYNSLSIDLKEDWAPPFQLLLIKLNNCLLGPRFPPWLLWQRNNIGLSIAAAGISDTLPEWFVRKSSNIALLVPFNNQMRAKLPQSLSIKTGDSVFLEYNQCEGQIPPYLFYNASVLNLRYNMLEGPLPSINESPYFSYLFLQNNVISSTIPHSLCKATSLVSIDMSNNLLFGEIPTCLPKTLRLFNLANNFLHGQIRDSVYSLSELQALDLRSNNLSGKLPKSLQQCKNLGVLSLTENNFDENIPARLAMELPNLWILLLWFNRFSGSINLSCNHLSGKISTGNQLQTINVDTSIYIGNCEKFEIPGVGNRSSNAEQSDLNQAICD